MKKAIVVALAVTGSLAVGPAALAATAEPSGLLPANYTPQHAGHDHGKKWDDKKHDKKKKDDHHHYEHHHHHHHHHGDGAHASDYHSHREHPRHW